MKIILLKKTLIDFLKENNILIEFSNNLEEPLENLLKSDMVQFCKSTLIRSAFHWSGTPEGHGYWKKISGEWSSQLFANKRLYRKLEKENRKKTTLPEIFS